MNTPGSNFPRPLDVSVTAPLGPAIERTKRMLFQPFNLEKWFTIGFCAWLAQLAEGGGFHGNFNLPGNHGRHPGVDLRQGLQQARDYVTGNLHWIVPVVIALAVAGLALWLLLTWLNCRGKFMFLHCVAHDRAEVAAPWREYSRPGDSLFWFRVGLGFAGAVLVFPLLGVAGWMVYRMIDCGSVLGRELGWAVGSGLLLLLVALVLVVIHKLTTDFVVPVMYLRRCGWSAAWREFGGLFTARLGDFVLYLLFSIVIAVVLVVVTIVVLLCTCCFCCLALLPYLGTVILLPLFVFKRSYSLLYFAQHGPDYNVFPVPAAAEPPQIA